jgi:hypothetical protein
MRRVLLLALCALLGGPGRVRGHDDVAPRALVAPAACPGDPISPTLVLTGSFPTTLQGAYVMLPLDVPAGTTQLRVKYCWDKPDSGTLSHTIDLGLWEPPPAGRSWGPDQFRGWGGSSHPDVTITRQGFSSEAEYLAQPKGHVPGRTTRGFIPGPIPAGAWGIELGVAAVVTEAQGDADGRVAWRVEVTLDDDPAFAAEPYRPARYDGKPANTQPGWYAGDCHVHAEHSALGDAADREVFDYAFRPLAEGGAGLDFITLSDYVTRSGWGEIGRWQALHPGKLVVPSSEVITYHGHFNNHASRRYVDHRLGPVYRWEGNDVVMLLRGPTPPSARFIQIHARHGWTQINHPRIFPAAAFGSLCRGCYWDYTPQETNFDQLDAIEIQTGPAAFGPTPNPFTLDAIAYWESALDTGRRIAAVGSSDSTRRAAPPTSSERRSARPPRWSTRGSSPSAASATASSRATPT